MFAFFGMLSANASEVSASNVSRYIFSNGTYSLKINTERQTFKDELVNIDNQEFQNCETTADGGALQINNAPSLGESTISNSKFISNKATGYEAADSGAISIQNGVFVLKNNEFKSNEAMYGGAIYAYTGNKKGVQVAIEDCVFDSNTALTGGAIGQFASQRLLQTGGMTIKNTTFKNNKSTSTDSIEGGGALFLGAESVTSIIGSTFTNNSAVKNAGAIETRDYSANNSSAKLDIFNSFFIDNTAVQKGGAIDNYFYGSEANAGYVTVDGATFEGNTAKQGGAIYNHGEKDAAGNIGSMKISNSILKNNQSKKYGGAIYNDGNLVITNTVFEGNKAANGAAIATNTPSTFYKIGAAGSTEIGDGVQFLRNETTSHGGAIYIYDHSKLAHTFTIKDNVVFDGNVSGNQGGAIYSYLTNTASEFTIGNNALFTNNSAKKNGGAIYSGGGKGKFTVGDNAQFLNNSAFYYGGAIYLYREGFSLGDNAYFEGNNAQQGGAIFVSNTSLNVDNAKFVKNTAKSEKGALGGAITVDKSTTQDINISNSVFDSNSSEMTAGAIGQWDGSKATITLDNVTFTNNTAGVEAGAVNSDATLIVKNSKFTGNKTTGTYVDEIDSLYTDGGGGAIFLYDNGIAQISDSTFENNSTGTYGGAISTRINATKGSLEVKNSTFTNNIANLAGGAIANMKGGVAKIIDSIFSGNKANGESNDVHNDGTLSLDGNVTFDGGITGKGSTEVLGTANVDNSNGTLIQDSVKVVAGGNLTTNVSKINVAQGIANEGTVTLTGTGDLTTKFTGSGTIAMNTDGTITLNDTALIGTSNLNVIGGELAIGANVSNISNKMTFGDATLNLINGVANNVTDLNVEDGKALRLAIDFNDKIETTNTSAENSILISKIDLSKLTSSSSTNETLSSTLGNNLEIALDAEFVKGDSGLNYVSLVKSGSEAILKASNNMLYNAIVDTADQRIYQMETGETISSADMTGTLVVNGNGQTIKSSDSDIGGGINVVESASGTALSIVDTNIDSIKVNDDNKGAFTVSGDSELAIVANNNDVSIANTIGNTVNNAIYLDDATGGNAEAELVAMSGRKLTIEDDIRSNNVNNTITLSGDGSIYLNGILDPLTVNTSAENVYRNGYDEDIIWNLNGGTVHYSNDAYLYESAHHGTTLLNTLNFNGGALDLMNGAVNTISLAGLNVSANSNLFVDVDLANRQMDKFDGTATVTGGKLNVAGMQLISETNNNETEINFTSDAALKDNVTTSVTEVSSPIYKYQVSYLSGSGNFKFVRQTFNPAVFSSAVAMQGSYLTQLANYDIALGNVDQQMLMTREQRFAWKYGNKYAANDQTNPQVYSPLFIPEHESGVWFRPYTTFERVDLFNGPEVSNVMYGTLIGGDSPMMELGNDWDAQWSAYVGYNGSHQAFNGNSIYQNGGMVGLTGALYKDNFFQAFTANVGASVANIDTSFGKNDLTMLSTGIASKTGYNWELAKGKFIIQPSWQMSYTYVAPMNNHSLGQVKINNDDLHAIQLAPGLKFIGNLPHGWQPYINLRMLWNIIDDTKVKANNVNLPETSVKPYFDYGLGLQKTVVERFTGFGQMMFRNGGRTGVAFTFGFRWALGKDAQK